MCFKKPGIKKYWQFFLTGILGSAPCFVSISAMVASPFMVAMCSGVKPVSKKKPTTRVLFNYCRWGGFSPVQSAHVSIILALLTKRRQRW